MFNAEMIQGKWKEIKGEIITEWGNLTDDEVDKTTGNLVSISGLIQQRYGQEKEVIHAKLASIAAKFSQSTEDLKKQLQERSKDS